MRLHHAAVICKSQENADRFYHGILGLEKTKTQTLEEGLAQRVFGTPCECQLFLYGNDHFAVEVFVPASVPGVGSPFKHLCLQVEDRDAFVGKCQAARLVVRQIPKGESLLVFVEDYDGNLFEIKELPR